MDENKRIVICRRCKKAGILGRNEMAFRILRMQRLLQSAMGKRKS